MDASAAVIQARKCGAEANILVFLKYLPIQLISLIFLLLHVVKQDATLSKKILMKFT